MAPEAVHATIKIMTAPKSHVVSLQPKRSWEPFCPVVPPPRSAKISIVMLDPAITVRPLAQTDIDAVLTIQSESSEIAPWSASEYHRVARNEMAGWVAVEGSAIAGFLIARRVVSDIEILNFAIAAGRRRRGIGSLLLAKALEWAHTFSAQKALLEVRISNLAAIRFYERYHFEVVGRRPCYYTSPVEDALLLTASLLPSRPRD